MSQVAKTVVNQMPGVGTFMAVLLAANVSVGYSATSTGTSHVGVTKYASLQVSTLETDQLTGDQTGQSMHSQTCLRTGSEPQPYRMSASSLGGQVGFQVLDTTKTHHIGYEVVWSDKGEDFRLSDSRDMTDVLQADALNDCDNHMLSIEWDKHNYVTATDAAYTDTLSLIFVIE